MVRLSAVSAVACALSTCFRVCDFAQAVAGPCPARSRGACLCAVRQDPQRFQSAASLPPQPHTVHTLGKHCSSVCIDACADMLCFVQGRCYVKLCLCLCFRFWAAWRSCTHAEAHDAFKVTGSAQDVFTHLAQLSPHCCSCCMEVRHAWMQMQ